MMKRFHYYILVFFPIVFLPFACGNGWLDIKRDIKLAVPQTLNDLRALLNNEVFHQDYIGMAEVSADDYYFTESALAIAAERERNLYFWKPTIYTDQNAVYEWNESYRQVFYCNVVLERLLLLVPNSSEQGVWDQLFGEALFYRAKAFYNLSLLFSPPYNPATASQDLGIPLRVVSDVNSSTTRATNDLVYSQIVQDLRRSSSLLPINATVELQPNKAAAQAMLARCLMAMGMFGSAFSHADTALQLHGGLLDFNNIDVSQAFPISPHNEEVIFPSTLFPLYLGFLSPYGITNEELYSLYEESDLRKELFFDKQRGFKGNYTGSLQYFSGTTSGEMLLIKAECAARLGRNEDAMAALNRLWEVRYKKDSQPPAPGAHDDLVNLVLKERRKELINRGLRWSDLRRLNHDPAYALTLRRTGNGQTHELPPNDARYTLPIPNEVINTTNIPQNIRP